MTEVGFSPGGIPETVLEPEPDDALDALRAALPARSKVAATRCPTCAAAGRGVLDAWARLAQLARDDVEAYAYFRSAITAASTGCGSRAGGDPAMSAGSTRPTADSCAALEGLRSAAEPIGEADEASRCDEFLYQLDPGMGSALRVAFTPVKRALITGITGQDGRHLSEFLAHKGYQVFGLVHGQANPKIEMVQGENPALELIEGDLRDLSSLIAVVEQVQPDEVYNLGAISFVQLSFKQAELTAEITGLGVLRMLEAVRIVGGTDNNPIRFYQASSSEMFGKVQRDTADRAHAVPSALALRRRQGVRPLHDDELPRGLRHPREQRDPLQPRGPQARPRVRDPQGHQRGRADQARAAGEHHARQPRLVARLGLRGRLRRGHVDDAPAGHARRLRRSRPARRTRSASCSTTRSRSPGSTTGSGT